VASADAAWAIRTLGGGGAKFGFVGRGEGQSAKIGGVQERERQFVIRPPCVRGKKSHRKMGGYRARLASLLDEGVEGRDR
jgi:hypothetical protein